MPRLAADLSYVDLEFRGRPHAVATAVLQGADGVALVDPGPSSTLPTLEARLAESGIGVDRKSTRLNSSHRT